MKNRLTKLLIPALMVFSLAGCSDTSAVYDDFCAKAADSVALLINSSNGKEIYASETNVRELSNFNSVLGLREFTYSAKELTVTWETTPADKWTKSAFVLDDSRTKITPNYGPEEFEASIKATISYVEDNKELGKAILNWKFNVASTKVTTLSLQTINTNYVQNGKKLNEMGGKDDEGNDVIIGTRGYITSSYNADKDDNHVYAGVFISDGNYSMQLYAGKLSDLWAENQLKVGDCVFVVGILTIYGDIMELYPSFLEVIDGGAYNVAAAVTIKAEEITWDTPSVVYVSSLFEMTGAVYKSGKDSFTTSNHSRLYFMFGSTEILVYCNYHVGEAAMNDIKTMVDSWTANVTTVKIKGILSSFDSSLQIIPIFGGDSFGAA